MEHLTKQQIVLLTLLVSFVTSLATGIITVSLMDQAPMGVTQTINQVVERTIERVVMDTPPPQPAAAVVAKPPTLSEIVDKVATNVVRIKQRGALESMGLGIILSSEGLILTDKSVVTKDETTLPDLVAILSNGTEYSLQVIQSEIIGDVAFGALIVPPGKKVPAVTWNSDATSIKLGDSVHALSEGTTRILETGIVKKLGVSAQNPLLTSIASDAVAVGSPLFTDAGELVGFKTKSLVGSGSFYPVESLKSIAPKITR